MERKSVDQIFSSLKESKEEIIEYKFLLTESGKLFVSANPVSRLTTLTHEHWAKKLRDEGNITIEDGLVKGGYLTKFNGKLRYWGESTTPIPAASETELFAALNATGAVVLSADRS